VGATPWRFKSSPAHRIDRVAGGRPFFVLPAFDAVRRSLYSRSEHTFDLEPIPAGDSDMKGRAPWS
jgi:hypothetical protein